jgi:hypothetical protein
MQAKDTELLAAYEQLMESARERARLRDQLILAEQELHQTRTELQSWRQGLLEVRSLMESVDEVSSAGGQVRRGAAPKQGCRAAAGGCAPPGRLYAAAYVFGIVELAWLLAGSSLRSIRAYQVLVIGALRVCSSVQQGHAR